MISAEVDTITAESGPGTIKVGIDSVKTRLKAAMSRMAPDRFPIQSPPKNSRLEGPLIPQEEKVRELSEKRKKEAVELQKKGKTLQELREHFNNDYSQLEALYKIKVGGSLISDPSESAEHTIPITKKCSIVLPTYNNSTRLINCLHAIEASSFNKKYPQQIEVVIVDDGSTKEDITQVVKDMNIKDLNVKVIRQTNGGAAKARYTGALHSMGDIIIMSDPDIIHSPSMIEETMKRHEVLDGAAFVGFRDDIREDDPRLREENIRNGSLGKIPISFENDSRVRKDAMTGSSWWKVNNFNKTLPMDTDNEWYGWTIPSAAWGISISASRDVLLKSAYEVYKSGLSGYGFNDEALASAIAAEGQYLIPNTGGMVYHQDHPTKRNSPIYEENRKKFIKMMNDPLVVSLKDKPERTDGKVSLKTNNTRIFPEKPVGIPPVDLYKRAITLTKMGLVEDALKIYESLEPEKSKDFWFRHDMAVALTASGRRENVQKAVRLLESCMIENPKQTWIQSSLAIAYGRMGEYQKCLAAYKNALRLDPNNWEAKIIEPVDEDVVDRARAIHYKGAQQYLYRGSDREALRHFDVAIALAGEKVVPWATFDKGKAFFNIGCYQEAQQQLELSKKLMPNETWVDSQLGLLYEKMGKKGKARQYFESAIKKSPDNFEAKEGEKRLSLRLIDWTDHDKRRSQTLLENPNAKLDEKTEVEMYMGKFSSEYKNELHAMNSTLAPMSEKCRAVVCIPAYMEGDVINTTLERFINQKDKMGKSLDPELFEIIVLDNHPESDKKDTTEEEIGKFQKEHPEVRVKYAHRVWKNKEGGVGYARKIATDLALLRGNQRKNKKGDLLLISADADIEGLNEQYISGIIEDFDENPNVDAVTGKWTLPDKYLSNPNLRAAQRLWYFMDRIVQHDAQSGIDPKARQRGAPNMIGRNAALRSSVYAAIGGYNQQAKLAEDLEMGWMIMTARKWDSSRILFDNRSEVVSDARRYLLSMVQDIPLINMYDEFNSNRAEISGLDNDDLASRIPAEFSIQRFEAQVNSFWEASKDGQYKWIDERSPSSFARQFKKVMDLMGVEYIVESVVDKNGDTKEHVKLVNINTLLTRLKQPISPNATPLV